MSIIGVGVDLAGIGRIEELERRYGERFLARVYHPCERELLARLGRGRRGEFLAGRFACKEAAKKALGSFSGGEVLLKEIYVINRPTGQPEIFFDGRTAGFAGRLGVCAAHVSISHDGGLAIAQVILESV